MHVHYVMLVDYVSHPSIPHSLLTFHSDYAKLTRKQQQEQLYKKDDNISDNSQT